MSEYRKEYKSLEQEIYWTLPKIVIMFLVALLLFSGAGFIFHLLSTPAAVVTKVTNPDRILSDYEWYRESWQDCKALDEQIATTLQSIEDYKAMLPEDVSTWKQADRTELSRLNAVLLGQRNQRSSIVKEYNARSMMLSRNLFKGLDVPAELNVVNDVTMETWVK